MRNIYLIGHMASGKTKVGQLLAEMLNINFVDTDTNIERLFGKSINAIFKDEGETQFRIFETAVLQQTTLIDSTVISTGGGILTRMRNGLYMKDFGFVIYLKIDINTQMTRLLTDEELSKRPIVKNCKDEAELHAKLVDLHEKRNLTYEYFADYTVAVKNKSPMAIVEEIIAFLNNNKIISQRDFLDSFAGRVQHNPYKRIRRAKVEKDGESSGEEKEYQFLDNE
ncbi:hypothetical protein CKF54_02570 [Psittacicella hinzii]|uniref:Shikimate kinase n=1 Tax=Psittacicella hinzii TaxID=2028575 RepID=A0A3A1Y7L2_9GAMM|nr:shikimate kinase [Psittacicella hinzii]RIY33511.1 hypothetical protein CKF54_02570 [Psittacicella hinzii]